MQITISPSDRTRPLHEDPRIHARRWFLLAMMCLSLVLVVMSVSGLVTAIPTMQEELNARRRRSSGSSTPTPSCSPGSLLTAGALGDRFGRKRALLAGLVVFGAGVARRRRGIEREQVIAGRAVMGIGAAFVMPATLSIITTIFPPEERSRAIARVGGLRRRRRRDRPDRLRRAARAVLVGLGGARQPAARCDHVRRDLERSRPSRATRRETPLDPVGAVLSLRRPRARSCSRSSRAARRAGRPRRSSAPATVAVVALTGVPPLGAPQRTSDAAAHVLSRPALQRRQRRRHRRRSS